MDAVIQAFQGSMNTLNASIQAFIAGFPLFMLHSAITLALLFFGVTFYILLTPHKELQLLRKGKTPPPAWRWPASSSAWLFPCQRALLLP